MSTKEKIEDFLISIAIPTNVKGFRYLVTAINHAIDDPKMLGNVTTQLYPSTAADNKTTASRAERAIRHAIEMGFSHCEKNKWVHYFSSAYKQPKNSHFIATVALYVGREL